MELLDDIGINATRYFFASRSIDTQMDFDLDLALKQSNENPVYYIEYANARICSILKNYKCAISDLENIDNFITLDSETTYNILNKLYEFPDIVISAGEKKHPHIIANYAYDLASLFHSYYQQEKIITENDIYTKERIALLMAIKIVLNNALDLLGIIPREEM
jgi:arginyl-tRNA synthetase